MKTREELQKNLGKLTETDERKLEFMINELNILLNRKMIDEDGLKSLENLMQEIANMHSSYKWRIIRLLKQGNEL